MLAAYLQKRRDDKELGRGLWRQGHDRFVRGLDRFHQVLEQLAARKDPATYLVYANRLADLLPRVRQLSVRAQQLAPSQGLDIPFSPDGSYARLNRLLSTAGKDLAACAQVLAMIRYAPAGQEENLRRRLGQQVEDLETRLGQAEILLQTLPREE